jgi:hypothetical protein
MCNPDHNDNHPTRTFAKDIVVDLGQTGLGQGRSDLFFVGSSRQRHNSDLVKGVLG